MKTKKFDPTQRFRIIIGIVCFYATAQEIRDGVGDFTMCNNGIRSALEALEQSEDADVGITGTWNSVAIQLDCA